MAKFQNSEHQARFESYQKAFYFNHYGSETDKFFAGMLYLVSSDFLNFKFEKLIIEENGHPKIDVSKLDSVFLSSTENFMMRFALKFYFSVECDYSVPYWYYQLNRDNQELFLNALQFLNH